MPAFFSDNSGVYKVLCSVEGYMREIAQIAIKCGAQLSNATNCADPTTTIRHYPYDVDVASCAGANANQSAAINCVDQTIYPRYDAAINHPLGSTIFVALSISISYLSCCLLNCYLRSRNTGNHSLTRGAADDIRAAEEYQRLISDKSRTYSI